MKLLIAMLAGLLFGVGLIFSGMSNPSKVIGFLDLAGSWDPSLVLVMGGAVLVGSLVFPYASQRPKSILGEVMQIPKNTQIDCRLMLGAITFGVGWGLAGYCPGPALASIAHGGTKPLLFVVAMLVGMWLFEVLERRKAKSTQA